MKKISTLLALAFVVSTSKAQFTENFNSGLTGLSSNCWQFSNVISNNSSPINGAASASTSAFPAEIRTPYLNIVSTSFNVSFKYQLTSKLNASQTRTIQVGVVDALGNYTLLQTIILDKDSPITAVSFSNTYTLATAGVKKLVINISSSGGSSDLLIDDLTTSASFKYGPTNHCNSAPIANKDTFYLVTPGPYVGNVITNDSEPDGETFTATLLTVSPDGTVIMNANGFFSFTPNPGFTGTSANFTYQICDNGFEPTCAAALVKLYFVNGTDKTLPVKLNNFQGSKNKSNVQLQWNISDNEIANTFEIERSTDGKNFATAALLFGTEKSGSETYSYNELNEDAKVYYRLKMGDKSDVITYSKILVFSTNGKDTKRLDIIGNSVNDKLTVSFQADASAVSELRILDMNGKMIAKQTVHASKGSNLVSISLPSSMTTGMYIASLSSDNMNSTAKFIKQ